MDPLLELRNVHKHHGRGLSRHSVLRDVSLAVEAGELVTIWGRRRSGRSTLLRIAAGVERPDAGVVCFAQPAPPSRREAAPGGGIGYCHLSFPAAGGSLVRDQLVVGQLARGVSPSLAKTSAERALERCQARQYAALRPGELKGGERIRVSIARALTLQPLLIVIDEPTLDVDLLARDEILLLLRSLADEGIAILASTGETTGLAGSDRGLALGHGGLLGRVVPKRAEVIPLRPPSLRRAHA